MRPERWISREDSSTHGVQDSAAAPISTGEGEQDDNQQQEEEQAVELPYHTFSKFAKALIIVMVSSSAMLSGLSSNIYFPAQQDIANVSGHIVTSIYIY